MSDLDTTTGTNWDHTVGVTTYQAPTVDSLLFVVASTRPSHPVIVDLTGETPANIDTDRDRAVLRAFLTLALQRLDAQEENTR